MLAVVLAWLTEGVAAMPSVHHVWHLQSSAYEVFVLKVLDRDVGQSSVSPPVTWRS